MDGQNSVICFVISKWLLAELSIPAAGQKDRRLWGREWPLNNPGQGIIFLVFRKLLRTTVNINRSSSLPDPDFPIRTTLIILIKITQSY